MINFNMRLKDGVITVTSRGKDGEPVDVLSSRHPGNCSDKGVDHDLSDEELEILESDSYFSDGEYRAAFATVDWSGALERKSDAENL